MSQPLRYYTVHVLPLWSQLSYSSCSIGYITYITYAIVAVGCVVYIISRRCLCIYNVKLLEILFKPD